MKKVIYFTAAVAFMFATSSVFTSCQSDDDFDNVGKEQKTEEISEDFDKFIEKLNESNDCTPFDYKNIGPTSTAFQVADPDNFASLVGSNVKTRGEEEGSLLSDILCWGASNIGSGIASYAGTTIAKQIFNAVGIELDPYVTKLKDISEGIDKVNNTMSEMNSKIDNILSRVKDVQDRQVNVEMTQLLRDRCQKFSALNISTCRHFINFMSYVNNGDEQGATDEAEKWVNGISNGGNNYQALFEYMDYVTGETNTNTMGFNMPQVYDYWVYQTTPWEHEGYAKREAFRLADISTVFTGAIMTKVYFANSKEAASNYMIKELDKRFEKFIKTYKDNSVTHHDDMRICQIRNAHFVAGRDFITFNPETIMSKLCGATSVSYIKKTMGAGDDNMKNNFSQAELTTICNYYGFTNLKQLEDKFAELGFNMSSLNQNKAHAMNLEGAVSFKGVPKESSLVIATQGIAEYYFDKLVSDKENDLTPKKYSIGISFFTYDKSYKFWEGQMFDNFTEKDLEFFTLNIDQRYTDMYPLGK